MSYNYWMVYYRTGLISSTFIRILRIIFFTCMNDFIYGLAENFKAVGDSGVYACKYHMR